jgi:adenylate cyclase
MDRTIVRKLTTILAADVEGYSRLMAADEVATLQALRDCRAVFGRLTARHGGRIVNTAGDGLLADFPSVVEAVHLRGRGPAGAVRADREL